VIGTIGALLGVAGLADPRPIPLPCEALLVIGVAWWGARRRNDRERTVRGQLRGR
jgi:hypothetical protein